MSSSPLVSIRAAKGLDAELALRGDSLQEVALRDLRRYYTMLDSALREVQLSTAEWDFLRDILNSTFRDENCARYLWAEVEDAGIEAEKWGVDHRAFAARLRDLPEFTRLAIVDAVDRWWRER